MEDKKVRCEWCGRELQPTSWRKVYYGNVLKYYCESCYEAQFENEEEEDEEETTDYSDYYNEIFSGSDRL